MGSASLHNTTLISAQVVEMPAAREAILRTLSYFDIFYYPLTAVEIMQFMGQKSNETDLHEALTHLLKEKKIFLRNGFFSIQDNPLLAHRRKEGNRRAEAMLKKANQIGKFLFRFPFVRAVGISGSLSKNYADERSDIDFFIITKANRLWISRTCMHLYKKLTFITGRQHYFCMNYYIDEKSLSLPEKDIFTAIEIKTLLPVSGGVTMRQFFDSNDWTSDWLPACAERKQVEPDPRYTWLKNMVEWLLNGRFGDKLDNSLMRLTQRRWKHKTEKGKKNIKGDLMGLISDKHYAWSNPGNFREKVLELYKHKSAAYNHTPKGKDFSFQLSEPDYIPHRNIRT